MPEFRRADRPDYFQIRREDGPVLARSSSLRGRAPRSNPGPARRRSSPGTSACPTGGLAERPASGSRRWRTMSRRGLRRRRTSCWWSPATPPPSTARLPSFGGSSSPAPAGRFAWPSWVGALVVRRGLRPLDVLAAQIAAIRHDELAARIPTGRRPRELAPVVERLNDSAAAARGGVPARADVHGRRRAPVAHAARRTSIDARGRARPAPGRRRVPPRARRLPRHRAPHRGADDQPADAGPARGKRCALAPASR